MSVLVTYASKHGATEGIARAIADRLRERGAHAEARPVDEVADVSSADAVVLGSAVYAGSWMKEAAGFADRHRDVLAAKPVWLFSSGPTGAEPPKEVGVSEKQLTKLRETVHPRDHRLFAGALDPDTLGFLERKMIKAVKAPTGDFRDWDDIRTYADEIADALAGSAT